MTIIKKPLINGRVQPGPFSGNQIWTWSKSPQRKMEESEKREAEDVLLRHDLENE
jgi:hypothetical protein